MFQYNPNDTFYDYEVLENITTNAIVYPDKKAVKIVYYTHNNDLTIQPLNITPTDEQSLLSHILNVNAHSLERWGISKDNVTISNDFQRVTYELLTENKKKHHMLFGYNSKNYENAISAYIMSHLKEGVATGSNLQQPILDTKKLRAFSNDIIEMKKVSAVISKHDYYRPKDHKISHFYYDYLHSDHFIDVQLLNPKMRFTRLERLAAQSGFQIETSAKVKEEAPTINNMNELADLLAYNLNDVFATMHIFEQEEYQTSFNVRDTLIKRYGNTQFKGKNVTHDTQEAKFIEYVISPNTKLKDDETLTLAYPVRKGYIPKSVEDRYPNPSVFNQYKQTILNKVHTYMKDAKDYSDDDNINAYSYMVVTGKIPDDSGLNVKENFYYKAGFPRINIDENGHFVSTMENPARFNYYMIRALDIWAKHYGIMNKLVNTLVLGKDNPNVKDHQFDDYANIIIQRIKDHPEDPLYEWLYTPNGKQRIVAKNKQLMVDLLEFMNENYPLHQDVYDYYDAYRGQDVSTPKLRRAIQENLPEHLKNGANILLKDKTPTYIALKLGGGHGNYIDLAKYREDAKKNEGFNHALSAIKDFYTEKAQQFNAEAYLMLTGETTQNEKDKIHVLSYKDIPTLAAILARRTKRNGFILGEPKEIQDLVPSDYTSGTYVEAKFVREKNLPNPSGYAKTVYERNTIHTDIESYYPTLIALLDTLKTNDGKNGFGELLEERLALKHSVPKLPSEWTEVDKQNWATQLANKKLLNSGSGAADTDYDNNNIRVNNKAYRMRIAGQLILLALAYDIAEAGGIPSSLNTDGIYAHNIDIQTADEVIQRWANLYQFNADTETVDLFISKDSNARIEYIDAPNGEVILANATLRNHQGADLSGLVKIPPIVDYIVTQYLTKVDNPLEHFDKGMAKRLLINFVKPKLDQLQAHQEKYRQGYYQTYEDKLPMLELKETLFNYFQMPLTSNEKTDRYLVYTDANDNSHYYGEINRGFLVHQEQKNKYKRFYKYRVSILQIKELAHDKIAKTTNEAYEMAKSAQLITDANTQQNTQINTYKVDSINTDQIVTIQNQATNDIPLELMNELDLDAYIDLAEARWKNWATA